MMNCQKCKGDRALELCGSGFTKYKCSVCKKTKYWGNTCIPKICGTCSQKENKCMYCQSSLAQ